MEEKEIQNRLRHWHFWFLIVLSVFLVVTFVYYLPVRFLYQSSQDHHNGMDAEHMDEMMDESAAHEHAAGEADHAMEGGAEHMDGMMEDMMHGEGGESAHSAVFHEEGEVADGLAVNFNFSPVPLRTGTVSRLDFLVNNKPGNVPVEASALEIEHEKLMHVIGVRSDMNEFFHIHPQPSGASGMFSVSHRFNLPGKYKVWSEVRQEGVIHAFGHPEFTVLGTGVSDEKKVSFSRTAVTQGYSVSLSTQPSVVVKGANARLVLDIHSPTGGEVELENYLGVPMHLAVIKDDWSEFIHTHPVGGAHSHTTGDVQQSVAAGLILADAGHDHEQSETQSGSQEAAPEHGVAFDTVFPTPGLYKVFAQFRPKGLALPADDAAVVSFWIQVEDKAAFPIDEWWLLMIFSIVSIAVLSYLTKKYIQVK